MSIIQDTHIKADRIQMDLLRKMSISERIAKAFHMTQLTFDLASRAIRKANPDFSNQEVNVFLVQHLHGVLLPTTGDLKEMNHNEIKDALDLFLFTLNRLQIPYYVGGSIASSAYGAARATRDVDMISPLTLKHVNDLYESLKSHYYIDKDMIIDAIQNQGSFNLIHLGTSFKIDIFILKNSEYDVESFQRRKQELITENPRLELWLASAEDVIISKLNWYRLSGEQSDRQWADIMGVLKVQANNLDRNYLVHWSRKLKLNSLLEKALKESNQR